VLDVLASMSSLISIMSTAGLVGKAYSFIEKVMQPNPGDERKNCSTMQDSKIAWRKLAAGLQSSVLCG
jgi:hypothetical protein